MPKRCLEVLIATRNPGKISEIEDELREPPVILRYLKDFPQVTPVKETGTTYKENAILKAMNYSKQTGICALADDSGLEVDALPGVLGVNSASFGGDGASDGERIEKLLTALSQGPDCRRTARFVCCMALVEWKRGQPPSLLTTATGKCFGMITEGLRGADGFGFDPVFVPDGYETTFGEMLPHLKRVISHRAKALAAIREFLDHSLLQT